MKNTLLLLLFVLVNTGCIRKFITNAEVNKACFHICVTKTCYKYVASGYGDEALCIIYDDEGILDVLTEEDLILLK